MAQDFYQAPEDVASQGDIVEVLPHLYFDPPITALSKAADGTYSSTPAPGGFNDKAGQAIVAVAKRCKALVITHDCEIDKKDKEGHLLVKRWIICPIVPLQDAGSSAYQDKVRRNRVYSALFLPKYQHILPDSFAHFGQLTTVHREAITDASRVLSLNDIGRRALYLQFVRWLTRWELADLRCPSCSTELNPASVLPVRGEE